MKRRTWLIVAILLIGAATAVMLWAEEPAPASAAEVEVNFPRRRDERYQKLRDARRTLPAMPAKENGPGFDRPRDPLLAALASGSGSAVVVEANAIRNSPVGELLLECLQNAGRKNPLEEVKEKAGVDLLQDLDRVAMTDKGMVVSGNFSNLKLNELMKDRATQTAYGDRAQIYAVPRKNPDGTMGSEVLVNWDNQMLMAYDDEAEARLAVDRLEGRAESTPVITEDQSYGEIYGVMAMEDFVRMLPPEQADLATKFQDAASRIELHVDTSRDVGVVATVDGKDTNMAEDLGRSVGGLLSMARLQAKAEGADEVAEFLELARVKPQGGRFGVEVGMPLEYLQQRLAFCKEKNFGAKKEKEIEARQQARKQEAQAKKAQDGAADDEEETATE